MPTLRVGAKARLALSPFCALLILLLFVTPRTAAAQDLVDSDPDQAVRPGRLDDPWAADRARDAARREHDGRPAHPPETKPRRRIPAGARGSGDPSDSWSRGGPRSPPFHRCRGSKLRRRHAPRSDFDGLDFANWGAGHPPDTNGDVGPNYYIQTVNTSIGIYDKSDGVRVAAFTFNTFMSQGNFGNLCDTDNFGDPVVLYDTFEDRWVITDFAFQLDGCGNVVNPPARSSASRSRRPATRSRGGWNFYSINITDGLRRLSEVRHLAGRHLHVGQHVRLSGAAARSRTSRVWAFNKAQMYAGAPDRPGRLVRRSGGGDFTLLPSNARLQTGTPPPGTPN